MNTGHDPVEGVIYVTRFRHYCVGGIDGLWALEASGHLDRLLHGEALAGCA